MRQAFYGGATGIFVSALVWLAAALVATLMNPRAGMAALFIGGMLIHPGAILLSKFLGRTGAPARGNPLTPLAMQTTLWLLLAIVVAFLASTQRAEWFFIAMLLTIAGRYFTFATLYGLRIYWACGGSLALVAMAMAALQASPAAVALAGGLIELAFAAMVFAGERRPATAPG